MKKISIIILFLTVGSVTAFSQDFEKAAFRLHDAVQKNYYDSTANLYSDMGADNRKYSFLWGLCAMVQVANEMEKAKPGSDYLTATLSAIDQYYSERKGQGGYDSYPVALGGGDRYYDDNQWIGITLMDAYERTKKPEYLKKATMMYDFMLMGYDDAAGGGLYWREPDKLTKNTCSNAPGVILALQLYQATKNEKYLKTGLELYNWTNERLRAKNGIFFDNVVIATDSIDKRQYSYNSGAMLQSNVYLYEITKDTKFLNEAKTIADASLKKFYNGDKFRDDYWFNAVMLRGLQHLAHYDDNPVYIQKFKDLAANALEHQLNEKGLMEGRKGSVNLVNQSGMIEILLRLTE